MAIIELKSVVPELMMRIGAILGGGDAESIEKLAHYGKTYGTVTTIVEEFMDIYEPRELQNRLRDACPPLPCLVAFNDPSERARVLLPKNKLFKRADLEEIKRFAVESAASDRLKGELQSLVQTELCLISEITKDKDVLKRLKNLLTAPLEMLLALED
jgi:geranylgeranyl pyrophosphate synthase